MPTDEQVSHWLRDGTDRFLAEMDALPDAGFAEPSALPGWARRQVIAHVARNAEAIGRLLDWARTGVETPMYASPEDRNADIERTAEQRPAALRDDVRNTARDLDAKIAAHPSDAWQVEVRGARGTAMPARNVVWMRVREVWVHAVDLAAGATTADLPAALVDALLDDRVAHLAGAECPPLTIRPDDRDRTWTVGDPSAATEVTGPAHGLAGWLLGRDPAGVLRCAGTLPTLPPWL